MKELSVTIAVYPAGDVFVAQCADPDVSSYGDTEQEALVSLCEAVDLAIEPDAKVVYASVGILSGPPNTWRYDYLGQARQNALNLATTEPPRDF